MEFRCRIKWDFHFGVKLISFYPSSHRIKTGKFATKYFPTRYPDFPLQSSFCARPKESEPLNKKFFVVRGSQCVTDRSFKLNSLIKLREMFE